MTHSKIDIEILRRRAAIIPEIRAFFTGRGYIEAETPLIADTVIPEAPIELFSTDFLTPYSPARELFLLPSPEYYLKQLIAAGSGNIFSLSKCFRNSEQTGRWHNPEFTMLEYYTMNACYTESITLTEDFFARMLGLPLTRKECTAALEPPFERLSMDETFSRFADFDLSRHCTGELSPGKEREQLTAKAVELGLSPSPDDSWEELFNLIFVHEVEPKLPADHPLVIYDYPAGIPALAKPARAAGRLERWELYAGGIELANCYSEETDAARIEAFFNEEMKKKSEAIVSVKADPNWSSMYDGSFPSCSGTAMGIDRLIMLLTGSPSIEGVILFPFSDIIPK